MGVISTSKPLKEEMAWATDKQFRVISKIRFLNNNTTKKLKDKAVLNLK